MTTAGESVINGRVHVGPLDEITCVKRESFVVSDVTGDIVRGGDNGVFVRDTRMLDQLEVRVDGHPPLPLVGSRTGPATAAFHAYVPVEGSGPDPVLLVDRRRIVDGSLHEEVRLHNRGRTPLVVEVALLVGTDFAYIFDVRHGRPQSAITPEPTTDGFRFVRDDGVDVLEVTTDPAPDRHDDGALVIRCEIGPRAMSRVCLDLVATDVYGTVRPGSRCEALDEPPGNGNGIDLDSDVRVRCSDHRFARLVEASLQDLAALRMHDPDAPEDVFSAAGSPWYLTLFGRDSLWAALMAVPFDLELAGGTLRTLARRQGRRHDPDTEEAPGKILHEIRRGSLTHRGDLPPNYYGTIDATPLFVVLAHEAWRWGLPGEQVAALLPHVEAALAWIRDSVAANDRGFLAYARVGDRGLENQGWKDSHDGVQFADGTLARAPIALSEVQGYAHDAALRGAELLDRFGRPGGDGWRSWAADLATRFHAAFWLEDDRGPYPVIALDRDGTPVDGAASNMGHLLGSGLLDDDQCRAVASRLVAPDLSSGWGLRTMSADNIGFNPLSYHGGSVWPHDTAIAVWGLASRGQPAAAAQLLGDLVDTAPHFGYRLPELFGGHDRVDATVPVPYPAACSPQAWAAGGALLLLRSCLGLQPSLPEGHLQLAPLVPSPFEWLEVEGLPLGGRRLSFRLGADGGIDVSGDTAGLEIATTVTPGATAG